MVGGALGLVVSGAERSWKSAEKSAGVLLGLTDHDAPPERFSLKLSHQCNFHSEVRNDKSATRHFAHGWWLA